jgi:hypothetical protein
MNLIYGQCKKKMVRKLYFVIPLHHLFHQSRGVVFPQRDHRTVQANRRAGGLQSRFYFVAYCEYLWGACSSSLTRLF